MYLRHIPINLTGELSWKLQPSKPQINTKNAFREVPISQMILFTTRCFVERCSSFFGPILNEDSNCNQNVTYKSIILL